MSVAVLQVHVHTADGAVFDPLTRSNEPSRISLLFFVRSLGNDVAFSLQLCIGHVQVTAVAPMPLVTR